MSLRKTDDDDKVNEQKPETWIIRFKIHKDDVELLKHAFNEGKLKCFGIKDLYLDDPHDRSATKRIKTQDNDEQHYRSR